MTDTRKNVIIIGGGVMGACSAYYLSKHDNCRVILIEKIEIACAASGKAGGFLALDWNDGTKGLKELSRASYKLHQDLAKDLDGFNSYGYRPMSTFSIVFDTSRDGEGESPKPVDWINKDIVRSFEEIGTTETTAQLTPELFTRKLIDEATKTGHVEIQLGHGVTELIFDNNDTVTGVVLDNGNKLDADSVIVCMGPWSSHLSLPDKKRIPVKGSHVHSIVMRPEENVPNQAIFTAILENSSTAEPEVYPRPDGTVYVCGALDKEPLPESAAMVTVDPESIDKLRHQASIISKSLSIENSELLKKQACYLPLSVNTSLPLIGPHSSYKGLYLATGHSYWGILNAPITGKIISEWIVYDSVKSITEKVNKYFLP